jgi:hypothetical protein
MGTKDHWGQDFPKGARGSREISVKNQYAYCTHKKLTSWWTAVLNMKNKTEDL